MFSKSSKRGTPTAEIIFKHFNRMVQFQTQTHGTPLSPLPPKVRALGGLCYALPFLNSDVVVRRSVPAVLTGLLDPTVKMTLQDVHVLLWRRETRNFLLCLYKGIILKREQVKRCNFKGRWHLPPWPISPKRKELKRVFM